MSRSLQALAPSDRAPSIFQKRMLDLIFSRYFIALHVPFFASAFTEPAYAFSRKTVVEMSLKAYYCARPQAALVHVPSSSPSVAPAADTTTATSVSVSGVDEYARLSATGGGFFRYIPHQASVLIGVELQNQIQEDVAFGLPTARPDLLNVLHDANLWAVQRVQAGETNIKGFVLTVALSAHIDASLQGLDTTGCEQHVLKQALQAGYECRDILKQDNAGIAEESTSFGTDQFGLDTMGDADEDWEAVSSNCSLILLALC